MMFFFDFSLLAARALVLVLGGIYLSAHSTVLMFAVVGAIMNLIFISIIAFTLRRRNDIAYRNVEIFRGQIAGALYESDSYRR